MDVHDQEQASSKAAGRAKLAAIALVGAAVAAYVFYQVIPALNGGHQPEQWHRVPDSQIRTCGDRFGYLALVDAKRNIIVVNIPQRRPRKFSEVMSGPIGPHQSRSDDGGWAIRLADGSSPANDTLVVALPDGSAANSPARTGLAKQFFDAAEAANVEKFSIASTLLALCRDTGSYGQLAELFAKHGEAHR